MDGIGFDPMLRDSVDVTSAPASDTGLNPQAGLANLRQAKAAPVESGWNSWAPGYWTAAIILVLLFLVFMRRRPQAASGMSEEERLRYIARLKLLLDQREANASPGA
jgi:flagellar biosynthesis/type III secretory pathway M-ring protein FliF/YscJ